MIAEISSFVDTIPDEYFLERLEPEDGLHILIELDENGTPKTTGYQSLFKKKKSEPNELWGAIALREFYSRLIYMNKPIDSSKKIHSSSPYALSFKFKRPNKISETKWNTMTVTEMYDQIVKPSFDPYFTKLKAINNTETEQKIIEQVKTFCANDLYSIVRVALKEADLIEERDGKDIVKRKKSTDKNEIGSYVKVYFKVDMQLVRQSFSRYQKENIFNKKDKGKEYGLSIFFNGPGIPKKPFVISRSTFFDVNIEVNKDTALKLEKFKTLMKDEKLPKPMPIFIDKEELNGEVIRLYNRERVLRYREIIKRMYEQHKNELSDYYLIYWRNTRSGLEIDDFDFVPSFRFKIDNCRISNVMEIQDYREQSIDDVFDLESMMDKQFFYKIQNDTGYRYGNLIFNYFSDDVGYQKGYTMRAVVKSNLLRHRKALYDYIYKSKQDSIDGNMFFELAMSTIFDEVKHNEKFDDTFVIREKLNILFSLNHIFDPLNNNFKGVPMASKIPEYQERLRKLFSDENYHITEDDEFAFAAGQLIYYILYQSEASNKTHALLEPYISKRDSALFKLTITRGIEQYKHALTFGHRKLNKLASEVLGYDCKASIKDLLPVILAGYFSNSLIFETSNPSQAN